MPTFTFTEKSAIPSELHGDIVEKDGKFELNLSPTSKVNEFRDKNVEVSRSLDAANTELVALRGIVGDDPEQFSTDLTAMQEVSQRVQDGSLTEKGDIAAEVAKRTEAMKTAHTGEITQKDGKISELSAILKSLNSEITHNTIASAVQDAINTTDSGVQPSAAADISVRAAQIFQVESGGNIIAKNGDATIYGADGTTPMSVAEWISGAKATSPHWFKQSNGGNAQGDHKIYGTASREEFKGMSGAQKLAHANATAAGK